MNNIQSEILTKLFEECAEVVQICANAHYTVHYYIDSPISLSFSISKGANNI
jgi:hypothetical protein